MTTLFSGGEARSYVPAADLLVTDEDVKVFMDVPGLSVDDLEIELVDDVLAIRGERAFPYATGENGQHVWRRLERGFGRFERIVRLPRGMDPDEIDASIDKGMLTVSLPKPQAHKPRRIQITTGASQQALTDGDREEVKAEDRELVGAGS
jgi:HSP20 family protein